MVGWVFNEKVSDDIDKIIREHLYLCYTKEYNHIWNIIRRKVYDEIIPKHAPVEEQKKAIAYAKDATWCLTGNVYDDMDESQW